MTALLWESVTTVIPNLDQPNGCDMELYNSVYTQKYAYSELCVPLMWAGLPSACTSHGDAFAHLQTQHYNSPMQSTMMVSHTLAGITPKQWL